MKKNNNKSMHESILEECRRNPILTEEELKEMMYFPSEEEIRMEEQLTERICTRIERLLDENNGHLSDDQFRQIIAEDIFAV